MDARTAKRVEFLAFAISLIGVFLLLLFYWH
jgi:hypothetical protein